MTMSPNQTPNHPLRLPLAQLPTPLELAPRLSEAWGGPRIWIKRDDLTGFGLSGNKVRKLEVHLAAAQQAGATTLVTCGAVQSNHCRATALAAAKVGMECVLLLRSPDGPPSTITGNHLLQRLAGATINFITPTEWHERAQLMDQAADALRDQGKVPWIMPAGASDEHGVVAFSAAMRELGEQLAPLELDDVTVWHASSSAGTTAGLAHGVATTASNAQIVGSSVGETTEELETAVVELLATTDQPDAPFEVLDRYVGLGYGKTTTDELQIQIEATRLTGLIWDPTYTGKALFGLHQEIQRGRFDQSDDVVFWHTGGGFAVFAHEFPLT